MLWAGCTQPAEPTRDLIAAVVATPTPSPKPAGTLVPTRTRVPAPMPSTATPAPTLTVTPTQKPLPTSMPTATRVPMSASNPTTEPPPTLTPTPSPTVAPSPTPSSTPRPCIRSGDHSNIQSALSKPGSKAILCKNAVFQLHDTVFFTEDDQEIHTEGFPIDDSRALLRVGHKDIVTAVSSGNKSRVKLRNVIIDGNRPELGIGEGGLIEWGGNGSEQLVEWVKAYEPRGWSVLVLGHGDDLRCDGSIARNNELGPAGRAEYIIADGISLACRNSTVTNNTIIDATDGGIVIFQAPGSLVANNMIVADERVMFYGISMVDTGPYDGDFSGTRVTGNVIDARGALIRHGIDMGPYVGCIPEEEWTFRSRGAVVSNNVLKGNHMGYGFVISGVENWTVTGNVDMSTREALRDRPDECFGRLVDTPGSFQVNAAASEGTFQDEFEDTVFAFPTDFWPLHTVVSEKCVSDLIGPDLLTEIKLGQGGSLWFELEAAANGELIGRCIGLYEPPEIVEGQQKLQVGVSSCEPLCATIEFINLSSVHVADMTNAEFLLDGFLVDCVGLPPSIAPKKAATCIVEDFVTTGFQVLNWYGIPAAPGGWGFEYPFGE